jgi:fatty acid-binding protein DegV
MTPGYGRCWSIACYDVDRDPTVRIVTNPGSDLPHSLLARYEIDLTPQQIVVDGTPHDTRGGIEASALRAWMADLLRVRPMLALKKGEVAVAAKISASADLVATLADAADASMHGRRVWIAVGHGGAPDLAERLADLLRRRLDVAFLYVVPFSPAIYLHAGPGSVGYCAGPVDELDWTPPVPEA